MLASLVLTHCGRVEVVGAGAIGTGPGPGPVVPVVNEGLFTSLAIDRLGRPHISFYDSINGALKYTWFDSIRQAWNDQFVDLGGASGVGIDNSLALDPVTNFPRISYYDQTNGRLLFASWNGSQWILEVVDSTFGHDVGQFSSLILDPMGRPAIAYYDATQGSLKLAGSALTTPPFNFSLPTTIDAGNVGQYCSLALDPATQEVRIAYYDARNQVNKLAAWDRFTLKFYTFFVDPTVGSGIFNSLAIDGAGRLHLAYYDTFRHLLKYARSSFPPFTTPPVWTIEMADPGNGHDVGRFASLTLDGAGKDRKSVV